MAHRWFGGNGSARRANRRLGEHRWRSILRRWQKSGLSQAEFCHRESVPLTTLRWWRWQIGVRDERRRVARHPPAPRPASEHPPLFFPVRVGPSASPMTAPATSLEVALAGGRTIRIRSDFDPALLGKLLSVLEAPTC